MGRFKDCRWSSKST